MCGIFGTIGHASGGSLERCARLLAHRGPDDFGSYSSPQDAVYLAHCRLSIIDLSSSGHQPMCNEDGTIWLTFNGEIYNFRELRTRLEQCGHRFLSASDSEVILHGYEEWGERCVEELCGMFAFGIWDERRHALLLARDRLGIKPLYYTDGRGAFAFASEPRAIVGLPGFTRRLCAGALGSYLTTRYVQGEFSIYEGIRRLLPGTCLRVDALSGERRAWRYWVPTQQTVGRSVQEVDESFGALMDAATAQHLVSDVPIGVFLSGGFDSAAVTSIAVRHSDDLNTFCIGFEGWARNEGPAARHTASLLGTHHHEISVSLKGGEVLQNIFDAFDEPLADTSIIPTYLVCREARRQVTVALSGDGGDELFGGYSWYANMLRGSWRKRAAFSLGPWVRALGLAETRVGRRCDDLQHYLMLNSPGFHAGDIRRLFPDLARELGDFTDTEVFKRCDTSGREGLKRWQWIDLHAFLVDNNLTRIDRASMAHSLEVRVPFLDHRLVEFALSLSQEDCISDQGSKRVLRRYLAARGLSHLLEQPKVGFSFPVTAYWPTDVMATTVLEGAMVRQGVLSRKALEAMLLETRNPVQPYRIWLLAVLEKWYARWMM